ncbi:MAG: 30S ribosomal protein S20 [Planctomycetota bacterium]|nr:30S ribosomal protein S20 [Planctomycetota bacterium]
MPSSISAKKRVRQNEKRNLVGRSAKSAIRSYTKKVLAAVESGDSKEAAAQLRITSQQIDKATKRGIMHRNTAARHKSRLARMVAKIG